MTTTDASQTPSVLRGHLRGSSLLLVGRVLALVAGLVAQVLLARHLSRADFGAFAYALSMVVLLQTLTTLGLHRSIGRLLPAYEEREDRARVVGTLALVCGAIAGMGGALCLLVVTLRPWLAGPVLDSPLTASLLVYLVALAPVQALDEVMSGVLAVFGRTRAIFVRQHLLGPGLRLLVVLGLIGTGSDVTVLAWGWTASGVLGLLLYAGVLRRVLKQRGLTGRGSLRSARVPVREVLVFTLPLLSTDLVYLCLHSADALVVGAFAGTEAVAGLRVVQPVANLSVLVFASFTVLYLPAASRLVERGQAGAVGDLYWTSALWVAVLTFPVVATSVALAQPLTVLLFGQRYAGSAPYLAVLSLGLFIGAAAGFNGLTLRVHGFLRYTLLINLAAVVLDLVLLFLLVPRFGALGGAVATAATLVAHNGMKQLGLRRVEGVKAWDPRYSRPYAVMGLLLLALIPLGASTAPWVAGLPVVVVAWLLVLLSARRRLDVQETFPAVAALPVVGRLLVVR